MTTIKDARSWSELARVLTRPHGPYTRWLNPDDRLVHLVGVTMKGEETLCGIRDERYLLKYGVVSSQVPVTCLTCLADA